MSDILYDLKKIGQAGDLPPKGHVPLAMRAIDEIERLRAALEAVEEWWLREGMHSFAGAPYAMFAARAALKPVEDLGKRAARAEAENARLRAVLEFYADPFGKCDQVPDFYSELNFGDRAYEALHPRNDAADGRTTAPLDGNAIQGAIATRNTP